MRDGSMLLKYHADIENKKELHKWEFFAQDEAAARRYILTRDGFHDAKILSLVPIEVSRWT